MVPTTEANVTRAKNNPPVKVENPAEAKSDTPAPVAIEKLPTNTEKVSPTPAEAKPEPPQGEAKPVDTTDRLAKFKEKAKSKKPETFVKAKTDVVEVKDGEVPPHIQARIEELEKKNADYEKQLSDEDVQILREAKKSGKDLFDILKEVEGINPDQLTKEQLYEIDCKEKGLTGEDLEEAMADFEEMKPYQKTAATNVIKEKLRGDVSKKKLNFLAKVKEGTAESATLAQAAIAAAEKTQQDFNKLCDDYIGKNHYGLVGTPQMSESLKNILKDPNGLIGKNQDGSLNANDLFEFAHFKLFKETLIEEVRSTTYAEAWEEFEKEYGATDGSAKVVRTPQGTVMSEKEQFEHTISTAKPVR